MLICCARLGVTDSGGCGGRLFVVGDVGSHIFI
jgi:hypothetical protein